MSAEVVVLQQPAPNAFDDFWTIYPRHIAKKDATRAWSKIPPSLHNKILTSLVDWRKVWIRKGELDYVPYPATWLNGERWEDELPTDVVVSSQSHVTAVLPNTERSVMPEKVRQELARIRASK